MILRLDPRYPLVWRTPDTIQLGIDRPLAIVPGVTAPLEGVIAALRVGVPRSGALMLGRQAGATDAAIDALLRALAPALVGLDSQPTVPGAETAPITATWFGSRTAAPLHRGDRPVVCVDGAGATADRIRSLLADLGITVATPGQLPDLAVIVDHFVLSPERHGHWLRRDVPHLPVLFSDTEVRVGPLVEPGAGPCLTCLELEHVDDDPAWPAIASQLLHRRAPTETPRLGIEVAATAAGIVHDRVFASSNEFAAASLAIDAETLMVRRRAHRPHERCGCRFLPESVIVLAGNAAGFRPQTS
ncbi:TOMM precursor leader peptide-binding protein [Cryobacterium adonitolivorans]|nr:TOMM precursor leader peptide-binding protein [Cryobacterium adonitolivorans]